MPEITFREAIHAAMVEEMRRDDSVFLIGEDIGVYGGAFGVSAGMIEEFGPNGGNAHLRTGFVGAAANGYGGNASNCRDHVYGFMTLSWTHRQPGSKARYMFGGKASVPMVVRMPNSSGTGAAAQPLSHWRPCSCIFPGSRLSPSTPYDAKVC